MCFRSDRYGSSRLTFLPTLAVGMTHDVITRGPEYPAYLWGGALLILSVGQRRSERLLDN